MFRRFEIISVIANDFLCYPVRQKNKKQIEEKMVRQRHRVHWMIIHNDSDIVSQQRHMEGAGHYSARQRHYNHSCL